MASLKSPLPGRRNPVVFLTVAQLLTWATLMGRSRPARRAMCVFSSVLELYSLQGGRAHNWSGAGPDPL